MEQSDLNTALAIAEARVAEIESQIAVNHYDQIEKTGMVEAEALIAAMQAVGKSADELITTNEKELQYSMWVVDMEKRLVEQKASSLGVDQQRMAVVIKLPDDARAQLKEQGWALGLAFRVQVRIYTDEKIDVLKVPRTALSRGAQQQWQLFAVRNGKAVIAPVKLGILNENEAEITSGLKEGETIIKAPPKALKSDDRVTPL